MVKTSLLGSWFERCLLTAENMRPQRLRRVNSLGIKKMNKNTLNEIGGIILDASITVHRILGPGLLESAYMVALVRELQLRGLKVLVRHPIEFSYKGVDLGKVYVLDLLVEDEIIVEIKSVEGLEPIFTAQVITYLKMTGKHLGYLVNFNVKLLKDGFKRIVYDF